MKIFALIVLILLVVGDVNAAKTHLRSLEGVDTLGMIKLTQTGKPDIYVTKATADGGAVKVLVVDTADHVRVYDAKVDVAENPLKVTIGDMDKSKSGFCRDSDIPTAKDKEIPTTDAFVTQTVLCPGSGDKIGADNVCSDDNKPGNIDITYGSGNTIETVKVGEIDYTGSVLTGSETDDKTLINNILGDYGIAVCDKKKRIPRGSYLKATKTDKSDETIYISDKNYIKTTSDGVTLIYPITKKEYLSSGSQYTIGDIAHEVSGKCDSNVWTSCTDATTSPCTDTPVSAITLTFDGSTYAGITDYDITSSTKEDFDKILSHNNCLIKNTKLTNTNAANPTIYVTTPDSSNKVNVLVIDSEDHVRVYTSTSSVVGDVQTITVGEMNVEKSGFCRDSNIPTANDKDIPTTDSFVKQSVLCKTGDAISTTDVCEDTIVPALKGKTIVITYKADNIIAAKVGDVDYTATVAAADDEGLIKNIMGNYGEVCNTKKRVPRGSYLKATKTGSDVIYISDKNYIKTTSDGVTLVYEVEKTYLSSGSQYTIGNIDYTKSGKCTDNKWTSCTSATTAPCDVTKPTTPITITKETTNSYTSTQLTDYEIKSSTEEIFNGILGHTECKTTPVDTVVVPPGTIMTYKIDKDITVYISDNLAVKEKEGEFLVYEVEKTPEPSTGKATGSKYAFTYKADLSGKCEGNGLIKCPTTSPTGLCKSTEFTEIVIKYTNGDSPSAKIDDSTVLTILSETTEKKLSEIKKKLEEYKEGKICKTDEEVVDFEGNSIPNDLVIKHTVSEDDKEYYIYSTSNIFYRNNQKQISIKSTKDDKSNYTIYTTENVLDLKNCGYFSDIEGSVDEIDDLNCIGIPKDSFISIDWLENNCDFSKSNITKVFNVSKLELESTFIGNGTVENSEVYLYNSSGNKINEKYGVLISKGSSGIYEDISMRISISCLLLIMTLSILLF